VARGEESGGVVEDWRWAGSEELQGPEDVRPRGPGLSSKVEFVRLVNTKNELAAAN
jgi:hypothetical protein